jgi:very-short-patch-repair endonuclease
VDQPVRNIQLIGHPSPREYVAELQLAADRRDVANQPLIALLWDVLPGIDEFLDTIVEALADAALACWPLWYQHREDVHFGEQKDRESNAGDAAAASALARTSGSDRGLTERWIGAATTLCRNGRPPRVGSMSRATEVRQLTDAITIDGPTVMLTLTSEVDASECLIGLARAAEWLTSNSAAIIIVVVPREMADAPELDSVSFHRELIDGQERECAHGSNSVLDFAESTISEESPESRRDAGDDLPVLHEKSGAATSDERTPTAGRPAVLMTPFLGMPHPNSQGEQLIARRLQNDSELGSLFEFNQRLTTVHDSTFTVDLLWRAGRVVVEIDGYYWHSSRSMFASDRQRDFELLTSGYAVLRLPHASVVDDPAGAIEKIRQVARLRSND